MTAATLCPAAAVVESRAAVGSLYRTYSACAAHPFFGARSARRAGLHPGFHPGLRYSCRRPLSLQATQPRQRQTPPPPPIIKPVAKKAAPLPYAPRTTPASSSSSSASSSSSSSSSSQDLPTLLAQRRLPLVGAALAAGVLGFYLLPLLVAFLRSDDDDTTAAANGSHTHAHEHAVVAPDAVPTGLPPMGAAAFDASLDMPERIMGIAALRRRLAGAARGAVLEVAVGTGRNLGYYRWGFGGGAASVLGSTAGSATHGKGATDVITSLTAVDLSADALQVARRRARTALPGGVSVIRRQPAQPATQVSPEVVNVLDGRLRLICADALKPLPLPVTPPSSASSSASSPPSSSASASASSPPSSSLPPRYDTVLQTFGLCSVADPVALLANMAAVVRPETGRIVLLEHGRGGGRWPLVDSLLDRYAARHFARYGCWWNRDMQAILDAAVAAVPGLEVVSVQRPGWLQFGTLWWIELRLHQK